MLSSFVCQKERCTPAHHTQFKHNAGRGPNSVQLLITYNLQVTYDKQGYKPADLDSKLAFLVSQQWLSNPFVPKKLLHYFLMKTKHEI